MDTTKKVPLYKLKKGSKFRFEDNLTKEPGKEIYIKGRPHTDFYDRTRKLYVTTLYAPGEPANGAFTGYVDCGTEVYPID